MCYRSRRGHTARLSQNAADGTPGLSALRDQRWRPSGLAGSVADRFGNGAPMGRRRASRQPKGMVDHYAGASRCPGHPATTTMSPQSLGRSRGHHDGGLQTSRGSDTTTTALSGRPQRSRTRKATAVMRDGPRRPGKEGSDTGKVPVAGGEDHGRDGLGRRARGGRRAAGTPCGGKARRKAADGPTMCRLTCANVAERPQIYGILSRELPPLCAPRTRLFRHRRAVVL